VDFYTHTYLVPDVTWYFEVLAELFEVSFVTFDGDKIKAIPLRVIKVEMAALQRVMRIPFYPPTTWHKPGVG
jgi:hypothetical protein